MSLSLRSRAARRTGSVVAATALVSSALTVLSTGTALAAATGGAGASLPYVELQAENAATTGTVIGPSSVYGTLPDEASYRKAVTLSGAGQYVEFTTTAPTNSIDVRYSIPDGGGGAVYTSPLSLSINGAAQSDLTLTDAYSWYYGPYPFTNTPGSNPHHFYDEVHRLLPTVYPAGTKFRLTVPSSATASTTTIDFADFENVAAQLGQPAGSVSVTSKGADATGAADSTAAFNAAIASAGAGGTVWIPAGTYNIPGHIIVNNVTVKGAGMWYSTVKGSAPGFYGGYAPNASSNVHLSDFAIFGDVQQRDDSAQVNGIGGALNSSTVSNIWIDHLKVGAWMDGPFDGLTFSGMRIRDTTADGINFHGGVTNSTVTNSDIRNTGDDGLATWADAAIGADAFDTFSNNTVQDETLANGIAIYGGHDNTVSGNRVVDSGLQQGGGIHVAQRFASTTLGKTTVSNNTLIRDGSLDANWQFGVGALWFDARDGSMSAPVTVTNTLIQQSPYEAIMFIDGTINGVTINNATIQGTGTYAIQEQAAGSATVSNVTATGVSLSPPVFSCEGTNFVLTDGGGNSGISGAPFCGDPAAAVATFPPYIPDGPSASPGALSFGSVATGATSAAQTVTVSNPTSSAAAVSSIAAAGDFAQTNTCGASIPANGSCTVSVTFTPTAAGSRTGSLTVVAGGNTSTVTLAGTGVAPGPIVNATPASLSFAGTVVGATAASQSVSVANTGTTSAAVSAVSVTGDFTQTNNCTTIAVGGSCTVTVAFKPTASGTRTGAVTVTSSANNSPTTIALSGNGIGTNTNIAAGQPATASSSTNSAQLPGNAVDSNTSTYWESTNGAFPQWLQVDLGAPTAIGKITLDLPPLTSWATRTQTLSVQGSLDGTSTTTIVPSATYTFDPSTGNTVSITLPAGTSTRYVRVNITANSGWAAGQVSELQVFPSGTSTPSATLSTSASSLTFGSTTVGQTAATQAVTITNTGSASAAVSAIAATGDFTQSNTCGSSIAAGASCSATVTFKPTATGTRTGSLTVTSNATNSPSSVSLSGTGTSAASASLSSSPAALTFGSTTVGSASAAQTVTVSNTGGAAASVSSVGVSGDYTQTNTCGTSIAAGGSCAITVTFHPSATGTRTGAVTVTSSATNSPTTVGLTGTGAAASTTNLALHAATAESSHTQTYASSNVTDGDANTYWESNNNAFPQWVQADLGSSQSINKVVLKLPPATAWATRTQTLSVLGSTDGTNFSTTLVPSSTYTFDPNANSNTVTITFTATSVRYVRINLTANSSQPGGQLSELEVYGAGGGGGGSATLGSSPASLSFASTTVGATSAGQTVTVTNSGTAAATVSSVTASGDFAQTNTCSSIAAGATCTVSVTFHPTATGTRTGSLSVVSNATNSPSTVSLSGTGATGGGSATLSASPTSLTFASTTVGATASGQTVTISNTGSASAAVSAVSVTGDFAQTNSCVSIAAGGTCTVTVTFTPTTTGTRTGSVSITSNATNSPTSVSLSGTGAAATGGSDQAAGKPITASSVTQTFVAAKANDGNLTTYWEGSGFPSTLAVDMGANVTTSSVVVKLNPDPSWGTRTQTIQVLGHGQSSTTFAEIKPTAVYTFAQGTNVVTIPVSATVSAVELNITTNSGAGGGQVAELQVIGVPAPNPDLTVTSVTASPAAPVETDSITESAVVKNIGTAASTATNVNFYLGSTKVGTASVGALAAGAQVTVSAAIGTQAAGSYQLTAKVDEANAVIEQSETNNSLTNPTSFVVAQISSSDLVASGVAWSPNNPSAGNTVTFTAAIKNQGTIASGTAAHSITLTVTDTSTNAVVKTLTGSVSGAIASGATSAPVTLGTWTAVNGKYTVTTVVGVDSNEATVKQANNTSTQAFFVGRGANMPYDMYEAEAGSVGGGATVLSPNRTVGDLAGEASGRQAVTLNSTGSYVQWTTRASTNTLVTRFSIPDASGGGGTTATLDIYVNGTLLKPITLTSKYAWLYNAETSPDNNPSAGTQRHIYDEASIMLGTTVPAGSVIKLQKDAANASQYAIDFVQLEQATAVANPDPAHYVVPASTSQQDVQTAIQSAESSSTAVGVYLPAGVYPVANKFQVSGKAIKVVGAGPWFTQLQTDQSQANTDTGFSVQPTANGSTFTGFAIFGNYTSRVDGSGQTFGITDVSNITVDNVWIEHMVVGVWGTHVTSSTFSNMRIRDTFADGINLNNGSAGNVMNNDETRSTGDDSFALFAAQDHNSSDLTNNTIENVTSLLTWRAAGVAIYGGENNTAKNFLVADTLTYSGLTISSLNFGYPFQGFGTQPTTFTDFSLVRDGGHFWGGQVFGAIWLFSATQPFQGIRVNNALITDPTYSGIMFQTDYVGGTAVNPITDTVFTNTTITGALQSGDAYNAKSGYGIWANPLPEASQGPAVGSAAFNGLVESNNFVNIQNTTTTFHITVS